ncbi:uncharacterized threonine-rich GPI-anchored glycoprotein PJ4664.02 [Hermetia illucens]|nr:uncharacterized threonine-rich GPI-anchored glycoprotein PJ4664.02 [Hermetia illucens]XP_037926847.1 uncharacterized threonine-rich GPI-anchored glycoprotein PJ4664.02 [Hermetia illucens]
MKRCILLLLIMVYNSGSYPTTEPSDKSSNEDDPSKQIIGSSVVTSVSVILNGDEPQFTDAVGNTIPKPLVPLQVASPINLLNPDRYEFYTFNDNGELVKRLMTLDEIQSIVANGNGDGAVIHSFPINDRDPEKNVHDIVESVQKVLNKEVAWKKNLTNEHLVLDTPDVSSSWSMILPAIFGNTGTEIFPNKPQQVAMTPEADVLTRKPPTKVPLIHKPQKPVPSHNKPSIENEAQNSNIMNNAMAKPSFSKPEYLTTTTNEKPISVKSTTKSPPATTTTTTTRKPTTTTTHKPTTTTTRKPPTTTTTTSKPTTTLAPTTSRTTVTTPKPTTSSTTTTIKPMFEKPISSPVNVSPTKKVPPTTEGSLMEVSQSHVPMNGIDTKYGSEPEFSEYHQYESVPLASTGSYGGLEADDLVENPSMGYLSPSLDTDLPTKEDINTKISIDQILETLTNDMNTEKVEMETNTKLYTTIEPVLYNGDLSKPHKKQEIVYTTETDSTTTNSPEQKTEAEKDSIGNGSQEESNTLHFEPLYAEIRDPIVNDFSTEIPLAETTTTTMINDLGTTLGDTPGDDKHDEFTSHLQAQPIKTEDKPLSVVETIDQLINDQKKSTPASVVTEPVSMDQSIKIQGASNEISMDDYVHQAATIASNLEGNINSKPTTTPSNEVTDMSEPEESNEISNLIPDVVNQITDAPQADPNRPDEIDLSNRVSNIAYLNPNLLVPLKEPMATPKPVKVEHLDEAVMKESVPTTTIAPETPVTHTRFNLRPTYQSHIKNSGEASAEVTTQTEPNSAIEVNTPYYIKINSIKAEAHLTTEPPKPAEQLITTIVPTTIPPVKATKENDNSMNFQTFATESSTESEDALVTELTTSKIDLITDTPTSHETEQAYVKLGESTEKLDDMLQTTTVSADLTNVPEMSTTTQAATTIPVKESSSNTLKPVHYYKHPSSATDQKLMQFNNQRPVVRPPALSNLKVTPVGQPPRIPVRLDPIPGPSLGLKSSTIGQDEDVLAFAQLCNELAFNYWKSITAEKISPARSLVISPFALTSMLSMVFLGARGGTSGEMNEILKLDDMVTFNPHLVFKNITDSVEKIRDSHIAAAAFIREVYTDRSNGKVLQFFKEKVQQFYSGHVEEVNFNIVSDIIRRRTNLLVKRHTSGKVPEYLRTNSVWVNGPFATISANLIQTDCTRASVFDRDGEMFFQVHPSIRQRRLVPIPAVVWRAGFTAGYDPEVDATVVAFGNAFNTISTIYVMPGQQGVAAAGDNLERLETSLIETEIGANVWGRLLSSLHERPGLEVQLPRFSHRSFINASAGLQRMGLKSIFNSDDADLRGLTGSANRDVYLSDMIQVNTFTTCGEGRIGEQHHVEMYPAPPLRRKHSGVGQEARSEVKSEEHVGTVQDSGRAIYDDLLDPKYLEVPLQLRPRQARIPEAPRLRFDKPFLYFVRHNPTGMILFMGRFNPRLLP